MKRNAIIRIIAWTVSLVILVALLVAGINWFHPFGFSMKETEIPLVPLEGNRKPGESSVFPGGIQEIEIDWVSGNIRLVPANVSNIEVSESAVDDSRYAMICKQEGETLKIEYCKNTTLTDLKDLKFSKDLTILVPMDWRGRAVEVDAASAKLFVQDLAIQEVEVDTASGSSQFDNCTVNTLDIDTASGDVRFSGQLNQLDCDSASAGIYAELDNVPSEIDMDTASGSVELVLPKDAGFAVHMDTMSGKFDSDFPYSAKNGVYLSGDGACRIDMSSMSGKVSIRSK